MKPPRDQLSELTPEAIDVVLRNDLASFVRATFAVVSPGVELVWNEYLDLICARLHAVMRGEIRNLIITMPPRHLKSICASVALPAFYLGHNPSAEVMAVSYGQELSKTFADDTRLVMNSEFYKRIFTTRLLSGRQSLHAMKTTARGIRRATSMEGAATGVGGNLLIFDDPQKANGALSAAVRASTNDAYRNTFISRSNDPRNSRTIIVMQRLHEDDFVGFLLSLSGRWEVLNLPAISEEDEAYRYTTFLGPRVYRRPEGAALHPARLPLEDLESIRSDVGEAIWATQYMQRPAPAGGGFVKPAWFKRYSEATRPDPFDRVLQSWDTASTMNEWSDYSVCTTWGIKDERTYLLNVYRKRVEYPDLKRAVVEQAESFGATEIIIEDHTTGKTLIQDLRHDGFSKIRGHKPQGDKQMRMTQQAGLIENGFVYVPEEAHWLADYLHELAVFPNGKHDDQVDSTSQALDAINYPRMKGWAMLELARRENLARDQGRETSQQARPSHQPGSMEYAAEQAALATEAELEQAASLETATDLTTPPRPVGPAFQRGSLEWAREQAALAAA